MRCRSSNQSKTGQSNNWSPAHLLWTSNRWKELPRRTWKQNGQKHGNLTFFASITFQTLSKVDIVAAEKAQRTPDCTSMAHLLWFFRESLTRDIPSPPGRAYGMLHGRPFSTTYSIRGLKKLCSCWDSTKKQRAGREFIHFFKIKWFSSWSYWRLSSLRKTFDKLNLIAEEFQAGSDWSSRMQQRDMANSNTNGNFKTRPYNSTCQHGSDQFIHYFALQGW